MLHLVVVVLPLQLVLLVVLPLQLVLVVVLQLLLLPAESLPGSLL